MTTDTRERVRNTGGEAVKETVKIDGVEYEVAVAPEKLDISEADLNRIKRQVTMSVPIGLLFKMQNESPKDENGEAQVGTFALNLVAAHFGYPLQEGKRSRAKLTEEQKLENKKNAMATRAAQIKAAQAKYGNA